MTRNSTDDAPCASAGSATDRSSQYGWNACGKTGVSAGSRNTVRKPKPGQSSARTVELYRLRHQGAKADEISRMTAGSAEIQPSSAASAPRRIA